MSCSTATAPLLDFGGAIITGREASAVIDHGTPRPIKTLISCEPRHAGDRHRAVAARATAIAWIVSGTWAPTATTSIPIVAVGTEGARPTA